MSKDRLHVPDAEIRAYNSQARKLGVNEFISKPITPEVVRTLVAKLKLPEGLRPVKSKISGSS